MMKSTDPANSAWVLEMAAAVKEGNCSRLFPRAVFSSTVSRKLRILDKHRSLTGWPGGMQSVSGNGSSGPRLSCLKFKTSVKWT